jgi:hypothetical protein
LIEEDGVPFVERGKRKAWALKEDGLHTIALHSYW